MGSTVGKVITGLAIAVGVAALVLTGVGFIIGPAALAALTASLGGITASMLATAAAVLSIGASLLAPRPKAPPIGQSTLDRLSVSFDVNAPRRAVFGNTATALDMRDQEIENIAGTDDDINVHRWIVLAAHKLTSIDEIWFDDEKVWTSGGGVIHADYSGFLTVTTRTEGNSANYINYGTRIPASSRRYTGMAYLYLKFFINSESPFGNNIPQKMTVRGKGMPVYDPRKDSTVAGGSGTQRADDCSTWQYDVSGNLQGENPALQLLSWLLGWYIINPSTSARVLSVGRGIPKARFNMPSFIAAANVCDESVALNAGGSERRYRAAGVVAENEDTTAVCDRFKSAMNADIDDVDGQLRLIVYHNDLGAPIISLTEDDVEDDFEWLPSNNLAADFNQIHGRYVNASDEALYQLTPYPSVKLTSRDGIDRLETVDYGMVQSHSQAHRLSKQRLQRAQYPGRFRATFSFRAHGAQKGDVVNFTFGPCGFLNRKFRVLEKEYRGDGTVPMLLKQEDAAIYAWDNSEAPAVTYAPPMVYSRNVTPWQMMVTGNWTMPSQGQQDANLLKDPQFGRTYWSVTSLTYCKRVRGNTSLSGLFPFDSVQAYVGQITLGQGVQRFSYDKRNLPNVTVGRPYYLTFAVAKAASGIVGTATVRGTLQFINDAGANVGSALNVDVTLAALPAGGAYATQVGAAIAPAGATRAKVVLGVEANTATGTIRIDNPKLLDKEPGADVTRVIEGEASSTFKHASDGTAEAGQYPRELQYKLMTPAGQVTSGVTWKYKVLSGTVNGFTASSAEQNMTGTGAGTFTVNSLGTDTATVEIRATWQGETRVFVWSGGKTFAAPPTSGGGGGGGGTLVSKTSGFNSISGSTFTDVTGTLNGTTPSGVTSVSLNGQLSFQPSTTGGAGLWSIEMKWQRLISGTWTDIGSPAVVSADSEVIDLNGGEGTPFYTTSPASITNNKTNSGLAGSTAYSWRIVARVASGGSRTHTVTGQVSVVA